MTRASGSSLGRRRRAARVTAVQALYQMVLTGGDAERVLAGFTAGDLDAGAEAPAELDETLFEDLVRGVAARRPEIDEAVGSALDKERSLDRLEILIAAILRAGTYELLARPDIDPPLTVNEYVEVTNAFFYGREPAFVNGVLDRLARQLRPGEMSDRKVGRSPAATQESPRDDTPEER